MPPSYLVDFVALNIISPLQGLAKRWAPSCVNVAHRAEVVHKSRKKVHPTWSPPLPSSVHALSNLTSEQEHDGVGTVFGRRLPASQDAQQRKEAGRQQRRHRQRHELENPEAKNTLPQYVQGTSLLREPRRASFPPLFFRVTFFTQPQVL